MTQTHTYIADLTRTVEIPTQGILSRTVYSDASINVVLFGFDAGQELSEHTAARPALLQVLSGEDRDIAVLFPCHFVWIVPILQA